MIGGFTRSVGVHLGRICFFTMQEIRQTNEGAVADLHADSNFIGGMATRLAGSFSNTTKTTLHVYQTSNFVPSFESHHEPENLHTQ